jgi:hypothetical protein
MKGNILAFFYLTPYIIARPHCPHQSCKKCPLYADTSAADKVKVANAAKKAARAVMKTVHVDVDSLLKEPPPIASSFKKHRNK